MFANDVKKEKLNIVGETCAEVYQLLGAVLCLEEFGSKKPTWLTPDEENKIERLMDRLVEICEWCDNDLSEL